MKDLPPRDLEPFKQFFRVGNYAAEVLITRHYDTDWSPTIGPNDVEKLDRIVRALNRCDVAAAAKDAKVFELLPMAGE